MILFVGRKWRFFGTRFLLFRQHICSQLWYSPSTLDTNCNRIFSILLNFGGSKLNEQFPKVAWSFLGEALHTLHTARPYCHRVTSASVISKLLFTTQHFKISPFDQQYFLSWWKIKKNVLQILQYCILLIVVVRVDIYSELKEQKYCWPLDFINLTIKVPGCQSRVATQGFGIPTLKVSMWFWKYT
jgi:hypothetical protein